MSRRRAMMAVLTPPVVQRPLKLTVRMVAGEVFQLMTRPGYNYVGTVDWGDGNPVESFTAFDNALWAHTYATAGDHQITITGVFDGVYFNDSAAGQKIISIDQWGDVGAAMTTIEYAFQGCVNLVSIAADVPLDQLTSGLYAFAGCSSLVSLPEGITFNGLLNSSQMFRRCSNLTTLPE